MKRLEEGTRISRGKVPKIGVRSESYLGDKRT